MRTLRMIELSHEEGTDSGAALLPHGQLGGRRGTSSTQAAAIHVHRTTTEQSRLFSWVHSP